MAKKTNNNLNNNTIGNDKLEEYLVTYDEKIQLVTANEFFGLHQEKLAAERKAEALEKYSIPAHLVEALDKVDGYDTNVDIPKEALEWVNEEEEDSIEQMEKMFLILAYINPLTSPKSLPNLWKF